MCYLVHGASPKLAPAETPKMFVAIAGFMCQTGEAPRIAKVADDTFPENLQTIVPLKWLSESANVIVNQFDPMLNHGRFSGGFTLVSQPSDSGVQRERVVSRHDGRRNVGDGPLHHG